MCGRFALDEKSTDFAGFFRADDAFTEWQPAYSIAPTEITPVIRERTHSDGEVTRTVEAAEWDFRPAFLKSPPKRPQFNARIETVSTLGLWKGAFAKHRCIVPMRGYYEWTEAAGKKWPHFIHGPHDLLAAAAIYAVRKEGDDWVLSCSIVTREARDASGDLHERMPVFLTPDVYDQWLTPTPLDNEGEKEAALAMLRRVSDNVAGTITTYEVDRKVNNSHTVDPHDPTLIEPVRT